MNCEKKIIEKPLSAKEVWEMVQKNGGNTRISGIIPVNLAYLMGLDYENNLHYLSRKFVGNTRLRIISFKAISSKDDGRTVLLEVTGDARDFLIENPINKLPRHEIIATDGATTILFLEDFLRREYNGGKGGYDATRTKGDPEWEELTLEEKIVWIANSIRGDMTSDGWRLECKEMDTFDPEEELECNEGDFFDDLVEEILPENPTDPIWTDGREILCSTNSVARAVATIIEGMSKLQKKPIECLVGGYCPEAGEEYAGWHYVRLI